MTLIYELREFGCGDWVSLYASMNERLSCHFLRNSTCKYALASIDPAASTTVAKTPGGCLIARFNSRELVSRTRSRDCTVSATPTAETL